jgi:DNA-binding protein YbaB
MKLKVTRTTKNKVITLELNTQCFTELENEMLEQLGEPVISIDRNYGQNPVKFSKKIKSNFKIKVKFDSNLDATTDITTDLVEEFLEDVQEKLEEAMSKLVDDYNEELVPKETIIDIKY